ncbi:hypothetical protein ACVWYI_003394 [Bradyrhizobium sp. LB13.1]
MRREVLDQETLGRRHVGIFDLIPRDASCFRDSIEKWRPLIQRDHAKVAIRVCEPCQAAVLSNRSHGFVLMNARHSLMVGIPLRPPAWRHFIAAVAAENAMAARTSRPTPIASA